MAWTLIGLGIAGIITSGVLTGKAAKKNAPWMSELDPGERADALNETAGTGIVPRWISLVNLASWSAVVIGVLLLLFR